MVLMNIVMSVATVGDASSSFLLPGLQFCLLPGAHARAWTWPLNSSTILMRGLCCVPCVRGSSCLECRCRSYGVGRAWSRPPTFLIHVLKL